MATLDGFIEWEKTVQSFSIGIGELGRVGKFRILGTRTDTNKDGSKSDLIHTRLQLLEQKNKLVTVMLYKSTVRELALICQNQGHNTVAATKNETGRTIFSGVTPVDESIPKHESKTEEQGDSLT